MKKLIIILVAAVAMIACNKNEDPVIHFDKTASEGIAGTYVGTWTRTLNGESESGEGTIVFAPCDSAQAYVCKVTATCADLSINSTGITNVIHSDYEYVFYNNSEKPEAGFGAKFSGRVYKDGSADMQYKMEQKVNKKKYTFNFSFEGKIENTTN